MAAAKTEVAASRELLNREVSRSNQLALEVSLRADSATRAIQRAEAASASARHAESRAEAARARFDSLSNAASPVCDSIVQAGRQALSQYAVSVDSLKSANADLKSAFTTQAKSIGELLSEQDSLRKAATRVGNAAQGVVDASQPSFISRFLPHLGAGVTAGVDVQGHPNAVAGITFGWTF